jgi:hypothetical protein
VSLRRPSGAPPPATFEIAGRLVDLVALAADVCRRYYEEYPDETERYGAAGMDWCRHDNQWLLCWAAGDVIGATDLVEQVTWLARVLHARDFPVVRLARNLEIAAELVSAEESFGEAAPEVAGRLRLAAATVADLDLGGDRTAG